MKQIICGETSLNGKKYKFDYRDNILVLIPEIMENFLTWRFEHLENSYKNEYVNLEGKTNWGCYICFIHVKFYELGSGALQAFVPGYIICKANAMVPLPKSEYIKKIRFYGDCIDKFYFPKKLIISNDVNSSEIKFKLNKENKTKCFTINKDKFLFDGFFSISSNENIKNVIDANAYLEIQFYNSKDINQIIEYYLNIRKFFSFINHRRYIKFTKIVAYKNVLVNYGTSKDETDNLIEDQIAFEIFLNDPDEEFDIDMSANAVRLEDIGKKFVRLYKVVKDEKFLTDYYPMSKKDDNYVDNKKFINVAISFESEFDKLFPKFKSNESSEYKEVKNLILKALSNKRYKVNSRIKIGNDKAKKKSYKKIIKDCNYFSKIISKIDGTLEEKVLYSYKRYSFIIDKAKQQFMKFYKISELKNGTLAKEFVERRNEISHGRYAGSFTSQEIIAYELVELCNYALTLQRCGFSEDSIKEIVDKIFK